MDGVLIKSPLELFGEAWRLFKQKWQVLLVISALPFALMAVLFTIGLIIGSVGLIALSFSGATAILFAVFAVVIYILFIVISLWSQVASIFVLSRSDEQIGVKQAFSLTKNKVWIFFGTTFVVGILTYFGSLFLIIPGLVLMVWTLFAPYIVVNEGISGLQAALTSRGLVRGRGWAVFGRVVVLYSIMFGGVVFFIVLFAVTYSIQKSMILLIILLILSLIYIVIMGYISQIYVYCMYKNLRELHPDPVYIAPSTRKKYIIFCIVGFVFAVISYSTQLVSVWDDSKNLMIPPINTYPTSGSEDQFIIEDYEPFDGNTENI